MSANTVVGSFSELDTLASCERKWVFRYKDQAEEEGIQKGLSKGTIWHAGTNAWWRREGPAGVEQAMREAGLTLIGDNPDREEDINEWHDDAAWLMGRYLAHYGNEPEELFVLDVEHAFEEVPLSGMLLRGRIDALVEMPDGTLWVVEDKTYSSRNRLDLVSVSWQETLYAMAAEKVYEREVFGVLFNGAYTYRWKRDEHKHPFTDSFQRVWLDRSPAQRLVAQEQAAAFIHRRREINGGYTALANLGPFCSGCGYRERCFAGLAMGDAELDIELEEEQ